jgi:hypothetical protein
MAGETNQTFHAASMAIVDEVKTASRSESDVPSTSSSSNAAIEKMANKDTSVLSDYWKKSKVTKADRSAYHTAGWSGSALESFVPKVDVPTADNSTIVCFECHLIAGFGLPPSKFLISITNFLRCKLVHLNPNAIAMLTYSGTSIVMPGMTRLPSLGLSYRYVATAEESI